jgi:hydroxymethylglutaryl-CoA lyase
MNLPNQVRIREVGPRDGFQSWPDIIPTEQKLEVIHTLMDTGLKEIEATSFVSPKSIPQMKDAGELVPKIRKSDAVICGMTPNYKGAQAAITAGIDEIHLFVSASEAHNLANVRRTIDESLAGFASVFQLAAEKGIPVLGAVAVSFGCPYEGEVSHDQIARIVEAYLRQGARAIVLADTTGMATPPKVQKLIATLRSFFPEADFGLHFHNNRGTAMVNLYAALESGVTLFDTALGGIGGCPNVPLAAGNLATEDVVYLLDEMGIETGIDLEALIDAARKLERILGKTLPGQVMKSGSRLAGISCNQCRT